MDKGEKIHIVKLKKWTHLGSSEKWFHFNTISCYICMYVFFLNSGSLNYPLFRNVLPFFLFSKFR